MIKVRSEMFSYETNSYTQVSLGPKRPFRESHTQNEFLPSETVQRHFRQIRKPNYCQFRSLVSQIDRARPNAFQFAKQPN